MLHVEIENILSEEDAVSKARQLIDRVDTEKMLVVITRQNRPAVAMIDVAHLEELTGKTVTPVAPASTVIDHLNALDSDGTPVDVAESTPAISEPAVPVSTPLPDMPMELSSAPETAPTEIAMSSIPAVEPMPPVEPVVPAAQVGSTPYPSTALEPLDSPITEALPTVPVSPTASTPLAPSQTVATSFTPPPMAPMAGQLPEMPEDPSNSSPLA